MSQPAFRSSIFVLLPRTVPEFVGVEDFGLPDHFGRTFKGARGWGSFHSTDTGLACRGTRGKVCDTDTSERNGWEGCVRDQSDRR